MPSLPPLHTPSNSVLILLSGINFQRLAVVCRDNQSLLYDWTSRGPPNDPSAGKAKAVPFTAKEVQVLGLDNLLILEGDSLDRWKQET